MGKNSYLFRYLVSERRFRIDDKYRSEIGRAKRMKYEQDQPRIWSTSLKWHTFLLSRQGLINYYWRWRKCQTVRNFGNRWRTKGRMWRRTWRTYTLGRVLTSSRRLLVAHLWSPVATDLKAEPPYGARQVIWGRDTKTAFTPRPTRLPKSVLGSIADFSLPGEGF